MKVGVLALQGAFIEHIQILQRLGVDTQKVRLPDHLTGLDSLIIPGGESTTIGKLAAMYGLIEPLRRFADTRPMWGTCAGMILMAREIGMDQPLLGVMDIVVERNAFGRQKDSFQEDLFVTVLENGNSRPFPGMIEIKDRAVEIARLADGTPVAAVENKLLVTAFHPELTRDTRFHQYFLRSARNHLSADR